MIDDGMVMRAVDVFSRVSIELQLHVQHEADGPALELLPVADGIRKAVEGREGPSSPKRPR